MILSREQNGIYEGSIMLTSEKEIDGKEPIEIVRMVTKLAKIDIVLNEVIAAKANVQDYAQMYKILEEKEGNIMMSGNVWRGRTIETVRMIFNTIVQSGNITEAYSTHEEVLNNFLENTAWSEKMDFISIGWIENYEGKVKVKFKMTKRNSDFIDQRLEIFKTKTKLVTKCKETNNLGKKTLLTSKL